MSEPLAPRNPRLDVYQPHDAMARIKNPRQRWDAATGTYVDVELARTPALDARREAALVEAATGVATAAPAAPAVTSSARASVRRMLRELLR